MAQNHETDNSPTTLISEAIDDLQDVIHDYPDVFDINQLTWVLGRLLIAQRKLQDE